MQAVCELTIKHYVDDKKEQYFSEKIKVTLEGDAATIEAIVHKLNELGTVR